MRGIPIRMLILTLLAAGPPTAGWPAASEQEEYKVIEQRMEQARSQLDEAARKLAELHSRMYEMETSGSRADEPMLGILLGDSGSGKGLTLAGITPDGGAERAGIKAGDTIVTVNGVRMDQGGEAKPMHLLAQAMSTVKAGDAVPVTYVRDGKTLEAEVVTQRRGKYMASVIEEKRPWLESLRSLDELEDLEALEDLKELEILEGGLAGDGDVTRVPAGLRLEDVDGDLAAYFGVERGVLVLGTPDRTTAFKPGDILIEVDGEAVTGADAALTRLAAQDGMVAARVKRRGEVREIELDADDLNAEQALHVVRGDRRIRIQRLGDGNQVNLEITVDEQP